MSLSRRLFTAGMAAALLTAGGAGSAEDAKKNPVVLLDTTLGAIQIELNQEKAPVSVKNFLEYVEAGHYNGLVFHRVIPGFMIQGGGMTATLDEKATRAPIKNEAGNGLKNDRGTIAMARTSVVDSATSQFFINVADNAFLNHKDDTSQGFGYAVFGKVVKGMDVVDKIVAVQTTTKGSYQNVPQKPVVINTAKLLK
jgi:peptidyl-prolyl cis-trans isomerase A (cyclophilin A)